MAARKRPPMAAETPVDPTPTTVPAGSDVFDEGLGTGPTSGGFAPPPNVSPEGDVRYSEAIGVEGRKVTDTQTGKVTYEGFKAPSPQQKMGLIPPGLSGDAYIPVAPSIEPRYFVQDLDALSGLSRGGVAAWQSRLNAAGILGDTFTLGVVDNATRNAYGTVLAVANREGITDEQALNLLQQQRVKIGGGSVQRYKLSNPSDIKAVIRSVAQNAIGRSLDDADVNRLVGLFQAEELSAQKQFQQGGVVTEMPSAQTFVESNIAKDFGEEVNVRKLDTLFSAVDQALGGKQ